MFLPPGSEWLLLLQHHVFAWECPKGDRGICPHWYLHQEDTLPRNTPAPAAPSRFLLDLNPNTCSLQSHSWQSHSCPTRGASTGLGHRLISPNTQKLCSSHRPLPLSDPWVTENKTTHSNIDQHKASVDTAALSSHVQSMGLAAGGGEGEMQRVGYGGQWQGFVRLPY